MRHAKLALFALMLAPAVLASPVRIDRWHVVGPFDAGSREGGVNPLADGEGRVAEWFTFEESYPSALVPGGLAKWQPLDAERDAEGAVTSKTKLSLGTEDGW